MIGQLFGIWDGIVAVWDATMSLLNLWPWFAGVFLIGLLIGALGGWKLVLGIFTLGIGLLVIKGVTKGDDYPTDVPEKDRKGPFDFGVGKPKRQLKRTARRQWQVPKSLSEPNE